MPRDKRILPPRPCRRRADLTGRACEGRHVARRARDHAHGLVGSVDHIYVAGGIDRHGRRMIEAGVPPGPSTLPEMPPLPARVLTGPARGNLADRAVTVIRHVNVARGVHRQSERKIEQGRAPVPSAIPGRPATPAKVVTTPLGEILRIVLLLVSPTKTFPVASTAIPWGKLKRAAVPAPSRLPPTPTHRQG